MLYVISDNLLLLHCQLDSKHSYHSKIQAKPSGATTEVIAKSEEDPVDNGFRVAAGGNADNSR